jgi:cytochrome c-type biogenesis protein CcmH
VSAFLAIAALFVVAGVAIVLWPLLRKPAGTPVDRAAMNRDILRHQLAELENDVRAGALEPARAEQARQELERRALEEAGTPSETALAPKRSLAAPVAVGVLMPVAALSLYLWLGNLGGLDAVPHVASELSSITPEQFREMTEKLATRMQSNPDDAVGWTMLGRAYRALERNEEAAQAFARASQLRPQDAEVLADHAEALAIARGRKLAGEPTRLLDRALKIDPDSTKALALAGSAAFERKDYPAVIRHWERLLKQPDVGAELAQALRTGIAEARTLSAGGKPGQARAPARDRISGTVSLGPSVQAGASPDDPVFVFARAASGPRMPLAIARVTVRDLPYHFELDDSMAMTPELKISGFEQIVVGARVSKSGSATPASGDLEGYAPPVKPGTSGVKLTISQVVK